MLSYDHQESSKPNNKSKKKEKAIRRKKPYCITESGGKGIMKFCAKCGSQMDDAQRFCPGCGFDMGAGQNTSVSYYNGGQDQYYGGQQQSPYDYGYMQPGVSSYRKTNAMGIVSLICSLVGLFFLGPILEPLAIIFGGVGISQCNKYPNLYTGKGFAVAGLVIGIIGLVIGLLIIMMMGSFLGLLAAL